jgi:predicted restriction endonuclease
MSNSRRREFDIPIGKIAYIQFGDKSGIDSENYIEVFKNVEREDWGTPHDYLNGEGKGTLMLYDPNRDGITIELKVYDTVQENDDYPFRNKFRPGDIKIFEPGISLDIINNIKGLEKFGHTQTPKWNLFKDMYDRLLDQYQGKVTSIIKDHRGNKIIYSLSKDDTEIKVDGVDPLTKERIVMGRQFQSEFRRNTLNIFDHHCVICGVDSDILLQAAHIKPVKEDLTSAGKFANGLCLCSIHHRLFDEGLMTISNNRVMVSKKMDRSNSKYLKEQYKKLVECGDLNLPRKSESDVYLKWHYENVFLS